MISADCDSIRENLDAFTDGELRGDELRYVSHHIESCRRCTEEIDARRAVGGMIRDSASGWRLVPQPAGLASGVVARVRAESAISWRAALNRAVEDWHWVIVGGGAVTATFVATLMCTAFVLIGASRPREDSLSALVTNLTASPGALYAEVSRRGRSSNEMMVVQLLTSADPVGTVPDLLSRESEERQFVGALGQALGGGGPLVELAAMPEGDRKKAVWLLDNIARIRRVGPADGPMNTLNVIRLHLVTSTEVTAKGLWP